MKALTLHQPWATLVMQGTKRFETRSWEYALPGDYVPGPVHSSGARTWTYVGPKPIDLAIHAGRTIDEPFARWLRDPVGVLDVPVAELPTGAILGVVTLVKCHLSMVGSPDILGASDLELELGDWTPGRWLWELRDPRPFARPVPAVGRQRVWNWLAPEYLGLERAVEERNGI